MVLHPHKEIIMNIQFSCRLYQALKADADSKGISVANLVVRHMKALYNTH